MSRKIHIDRLYPDVYEKGLQHKLKIDHESIMYITTPSDAQLITNIIISHLKNNNNDNNMNTIQITDATAGVGGNTISFAKYFGHVNSIEIDNTRFNYLSNNVNAYNFTNVTFYNDDMMVILHKLERQDVIFIDPPWGGKAYKKTDKLHLHINDIPLEEVCRNVITIHPTSILVLKLPSNFDIEFMEKELNDMIITKYELNKMIILVIQQTNEQINEQIEIQNEEKKESQT